MTHKSSVTLNKLFMVDAAAERCALLGSKLIVSAPGKFWEEVFTVGREHAERAGDGQGREQAEET